VFVPSILIARNIKNVPGTKKQEKHCEGNKTKNVKQLDFRRYSVLVLEVQRRLSVGGNVVQEAEVLRLHKGAGVAVVVAVHHVRCIQPPTKTSTCIC
jgi:hypothetical protein